MGTPATSLLYGQNSHISKNTREEGSLGRNISRMQCPKKFLVNETFVLRNIKCESCRLSVCFFLSVGTPTTFLYGLNSHISKATREEGSLGRNISKMQCPKKLLVNETFVLCNIKCEACSCLKGEHIKRESCSFLKGNVNPVHVQRVNITS